MPKNKMSTVSEAKATQSKTVRKDDAFKLEKFKSSILTAELCDLVRPTSSEIIEKLGNLANDEKAIGVALIKLKNEFSNFAKTKEISESAVGKALNEYIQTAFGILPSRAYDYMAVAGSEAVSKLGLPISSLVELARLSPEELKGLLSKNDESNLKALSFREVKALVKSHNSRATKKVRAKSANRLFPEAPTLDQNMKTVFDELEKMELPEIALANVVSLNQQISDKFEGEFVVEEFRKSFERIKSLFSDRQTNEELDALVEEIVSWHTEKFQQRKGA